MNPSNFWPLFLTYMTVILLLSFKHPLIYKIRLPLLTIYLSGLIIFSTYFLPWQKLILASAGALYLIKLYSISTFNISLATDGAWGRIIYFTIWPGITELKKSNKVLLNQPLDGPIFTKGYFFLMLGITILVATTVLQNHIPQIVSGYLFITGLLFTIHFGYSSLLFITLRYLKFDTKPLFNDPLSSVGISDFWSKRWNLAYVDMNKKLWAPLFNKLSSNTKMLSIFILSGLLHELAISFPVGDGYGFPMLYFIIQGIGMYVDKKFLQHTPPFLKRLITWVWILLPVPLLFHTPFIEGLIFPFQKYLYTLLNTYSSGDYMNVLLRIAGLGHFLVLVASVQVPHKLNWRVELPRLSALNRKLFLVYGAYIFLGIVGMGIISQVYFKDILGGTDLGLFISGFIVLFWLGRIITDFFIFDHKDWPEGMEFVVGHCLLTTLFLFICIVFALNFWIHFLQHRSELF